MGIILLTGFSGTGKSAVGKAVARILGWAFLDTDQMVAGRAGKRIDAIFAQDGEETFRQMERETLEQACAQDQTVVATGGGAFVQESNREVMLRSGMVVCLEASPSVIVERLFGVAKSPGLENTKGGEEVEVRPLLAAGPEERLAHVQALKARRQWAYSCAHWTVHTDRLTVEETAREVVRAWDTLRHRLVNTTTAPPAAMPAASHMAYGKDAEVAAVVFSSAGACPIHLGWGVLSQLGRWCREARLTSTAYLFTDSNVAGRHAPQAQASLEEAGIAVRVLTIPAGEASKSMAQAQRCYEWLAAQRAERGHFIVALGGGVVGDLAGFVAATYARGIPIVQVPTSLAAIVDASIGGKTAVDLPAGKNLVGVFHQPRFVLADAKTLTTLPTRELASGCAEAIKHGLILDEELVTTFEDNADAILRLEPDFLIPALRRSIAIKAHVVTQDERETLGIRSLLNYGHTLGHALEAASGYGTLFHGEAVAIGMNAAGTISRRMGLLSAEALERQSRLLQRYGLPLRCLPGLNVEAVLDAIEVDKKTVGGRVRWVLLEELGRAAMRVDVPPELVREVVSESV